MTSKAEQQPQPHRGSGLAERSFDGRTALAIFPLALYVVLRVAYVRFYGPFGLAPDDLGLGYVELLAQSAIGAAALLSVIGLAVSIWVAVGVGLARENPVTTLIRFTGQLGLIAQGFLVLLILLATGQVLFPGSIVVYPAYFGEACLVAVAGVSGATQVRRGLVGELTWRGKPATPWWRGAVLTALTVSIALTGASLSENADRDAKAVMNGVAIHPMLWGVRITSWGAEPATLTWTTDKVDATLRQLAGSCLMYLGQSGGTLFVYAKSLPGPATFRIPAAMAVMQLVPGGHCVSGMRTPVTAPRSGSVASDPLGFVILPGY